MLSPNDIIEYQNCSGALWKLFKDLATKEHPEKDKAMDEVFATFRACISNYAGQRVYSYAVQYAQALTYELERIIYGGRVVKHDRFIIQRMTAEEFNAYRDTPNVNDVITETKPDGTQIRWHVDAIIKP